LRSLEVATQDIFPLKQGTKVSGNYLGRVSGGSQRRQCPPKEKKSPLVAVLEESVVATLEILSEK